MKLKYSMQIKSYYLFQTWRFSSTAEKIYEAQATTKDLFYRLHVKHSHTCTPSAYASIVLAPRCSHCDALYLQTPKQSSATTLPV